MRDTLASPTAPASPVRPCVVYQKCLGHSSGPRFARCPYPVQAERIFEKYARVERDDALRSRDSRGLGLRFCKVVADAHGGRIWVEDAEPEGARFCVELPAGGHDRPDV